MDKRRVVITGVGAVSCVGHDVNSMWDALVNGKCGLDKITRFDVSAYRTQIAGEVKDFDPTKYMSEKEARRMDRYTQFAMVAADEAIKDSGIVAGENVDPYRYGVIVGSAAGGFDTFEKQHDIITAKGPTKCSPFTVPMIIADMGAGRISIKHGAKGVNKAVVTACATSAHSVGDAFRSIQWDDADVIVAGGAEAVITKLGIGAFTSARTLSKHNDEPQKASRPYDKDRDGFIMAEGAAVLILEELEHAKKRGAKIYAEIVGYGQTADAYDIVAPAADGSGAAMAMTLALKDAGVEPKAVNYVNAHGTSTGLGDIAESQAIARVFGDLKSNPDLKVSSTKSMHGHMLGATGAAESIVCIEAINNSIVPPTINLDNQDEAVADLNYVPHKPQKAEVKYALSNSFGFGGHNASLLFKKYED